MLLAFVEVATPRGQAYVVFTPLVVWPTGDIPMDLQLGSAGTVMLDGNTSWNRVAQNALDAWNHHLNTVQFRVYTGSSKAPADRDAVNQVFFSSTIYGQSFGPYTLAVTTGWSVGATRTEGDTIFNTAMRWNSYRGNLRVVGGEWVNDLYRVALHEFGHTLGLDHPDESGQNVVAVMNSMITDVDDLTTDDIAGATWLYYRVPPAITTQPQSKTARLGDTVAFGVSASGAQPMAYQWRRNGTVLPGATSGSYTIPNVQANHAGNYTVVVSNAAGGVISATAVLSINQAPSTSQLRLFSVNNGDPTVREWDASNGAFLGDVAILNGNSGTFSNISDIEYDGRYLYGLAMNGPWILRFDVTGFYLDTMSLVDGAGNPFPQAQCGLALDENYFYTIAPNDPRVRRFDRSGHYLADAAVLSLSQSGITKDGLTFLTMAAGDYRIRRFDLSGNFMGDVIGFHRSGVADGNNTGIALYQIPVAPIITVQPVSVFSVPGGKVEFSVGASGTAPLTYQWYRNNWAMAGATGATHTINSAQTYDAGPYKAVVRNSGGAAMSSVATLTVDASKPLVIISSPAPGARLTNSVATLNGTASDNLGVATVEWRLENSQGIGSYQAAVGTSSWLAVVAGLTPGLNTVRARACDVVGNWSAEITNSFTYVVLSPLTVGINGLGSITPNLNGQLLELGKTYTLTALPASGYVLSNWTGGVVTNSAKLSFVMQSNLTLTANFHPNPFIPMRGVYTGLFYDTNGVQHDSSGLFAASITDKGAFTATLRSAGRRLAFSGQFDLDGRASKAVPRVGTNALAVQLQLDMTPGTDRLSGQLSDGTWSAELAAHRTVFNVKTNPTPFAGHYTLIIPGFADDPTLPGGDGCGSVTVLGGGTVALAGTLADGTVMTQRAPLSKEGHWPLYVSLYGGKGSILSWVTFTNSTNVGGRLNWNKPALATSKYYRDGFSIESMLTGSAYSPPVSATDRILSFSNGVVVWSGGNLSQPMTNNVVISPNNKVTLPASGKTVLTIAPATGLLRGSVSDATTGKLFLFKGALLKGWDSGAGYFLGTNQSGRVTLLPGE